MQAALGLSQLARIDSLLEHKRSVGRHYQELFSDLEGVALPLASHRGSDNVYWVFGMVLEADFHRDAREVMTMLQERGIGTRPFFFPLHQQPVLTSYGFGQQRSLPMAEWLGRQGFYLPNGADLTAAQREYVATQVKEVLQK
jgi:perosamine synthetase